MKKIVVGYGGKGLAGIDPVDPPDLHEEEARKATARLSELGIEAAP